MTILLAIGSRHSGAQDVFSLLREAGLAEPLNSTDAAPSPEVLQAEILRAHDIDPNLPDSLEQVDVSGRWQQRAASALKAPQGAPLWGWCDPATLPLMDFWLAVDASTRILMIYADPAEELVRSRAATPSSGAASVLDDWHRWNDALLRYQFRHSDRTLLVNSRAAMENPGRLLELMASSIGVKGLNAPTARAPVLVQSGSLLLQAAQVAVSMRDDVRGLHQELHDAAPLNGKADPQSSPDAPALWDTARKFVDNAEQGLAKLREELGKGAEEVTRAFREADRTKSEAARLAAECQQAAAEQARIAGDCERLQSERDFQEQLANERYLELVQLKEQLAVLQQQLTEKAGQVAAVQEQLESAQEDKELVELQMQQVQEELAHYFTSWQDERARLEPAITPALSALDRFWKTQQPDELALDWRKPIAGEQWYDAEVDGRWSGPDPISSLPLPPVQPGAYLVEMDVIDAMDASIIEEAQLEIDGRRHSFKIEYFGGEGRAPALCSTRVQVGEHAGEGLLLKLHLPMTISPSVHGGDDTRQLGLKLQQVRLIRDAGA